MKATEGLTLDAALAAEHAIFASFPNAEGYLINAGPTPGFNTATILDATGNQTPNSPKFVGTLGAEYNYPLPNGAHIDVTGKAYFNGGFYWDSANQLRQKSYHLLNATMAYAFPGDHFTVRAWGTNLTNSYYGYNEEAFAFSVIALDAPPRMYGLTLDWKY